MNNTIKQAFMQILNDADLGYPITWPAVKFTPPSSGIWLETAYAPNADLDNGLGYSDGTIARGFFQVTVYDRPNNGSINIGVVAEQLQALFAKGTLLTAMVRVVKRPVIMSMDAEDDRISIPVSVEYSG